MFALSYFAAFITTGLLLIIYIAIISSLKGPIQ